MSDVLRVRCQTCTSSRTMPTPTYPVKVQHSCDLVEPGRSRWALVPEDNEPPTGALR